MKNGLTKSEVKSTRDIFVKSALSVKNIFLNEKVSLTFNNYNNTLIEYISSNESDIETLNNLITDLNLWFSYFADLEGLTKSIFLKKQNMKSYVDSFPKTPKNQLKSQELSSEIIRLKLFLKQVVIQKRMFSNMSFHCLDMYNKACEHYLYRY